MHEIYGLRDKERNVITNMDSIVEVAEVVEAILRMEIKEEEGQWN